MVMWGVGMVKEKTNYFENVHIKPTQDMPPLCTNIHVTDTVRCLTAIPYHSLLLSKSTSQYRSQKCQKHSLSSSLAVEMWPCNLTNVKVCWGFPGKIYFLLGKRDTKSASFFFAPAFEHSYLEEVMAGIVRATL